MNTAVFIWNFNPVLAHIGPLTLYYYGLCFATGILVAYQMGARMILQKKLSLQHWESLTFWIVLGAVIGARVGHIVFYEWDYFSRHLSEIPKLWHGGLSSHGGILGSIAALWLYKINHKSFDWRAYADIIAQNGAWIVVAVRLGNFFNSEIVGRPTEMPWGVIFERVDFVPRHPSQIYELLLGVMILMIFGWLNKKNIQRKAGFDLGLFGALYFGGRFFLEFFKDLAIHPNLLGLTTGQFLCLMFFPAVLLLLRPFPASKQQ